jgi:hypothetical protein
MQLVCIRQRDDIPGVEVPDLESSRIAIRVALQRGFDALGVRPSCIVHKVVVLHWLHACVAPGDLVPIAKIGFALRLASCFMVPGEGRHHDFDNSAILRNRPKVFSQLPRSYSYNTSKRVYTGVAI